MPDKSFQFASGLTASPTVQYLIAFLVILGVLGLIAFLARRFMRRRRTAAAESAQRGRQPRLGIVDMYELDAQRRLILLRRDNVEHLVLVGGPNDVVVERQIERTPLSRSEPVVEIQGPLDEASVEPVPEPAKRTPPPAETYIPVQAMPGPGPAQTAPKADADPVKVAGTKPPKKAVPSPATPVVIPPKPKTSESRLDPEILLDMATQLEAALSVPTPAKAPPETKTPAPVATGKPSFIPVPEAKPAEQAVPKASAGDETQPAAQPKAVSRPSLPGAPVASVPALPAVVPPTKAPVPVSPKPSSDPFSIEEIEAEFNRLLGRPKEHRGNGG